MFPVDAQPYLPQRPPFVFVDRILECENQCIKTDFVITADHELVHDGFLLETGVMENIAQSCAACIGWENRDKGVRVGVIGSVNNWEAHFCPRVGDTLLTTINIGAQVFDATIVEAETRCNGQLVAKCEMKVFLV